MANLVKKKIKGKIYWYIGESKRIDGRVKRIWQKYLGPAEKVAEQLLDGAVPQEVDVLSLGLCAAMLNIDEKIGFTDIVNKVISKREQGLSYGEHLMLTLINRLDNPVSKNKFVNWFDGTVLKRIYPVNKKLTAKPVEVGKYDLVLDPSNLWLTIHESIGHPTELDRALGYEANYAGTSFVAPPESKLGRSATAPDIA